MKTSKMQKYGYNNLLRRIVSALWALIAAASICQSECLAIEKSKLVYSSKPNCDKKIALTFDDGPHPRYTDEILAILAQYNISATFFVIGENVEQYPDVTKRVIEAGHEIGNHTYSHIYMNSGNIKPMSAEIEKTNTLLRENFGYNTKLIRPPGGLYGDNALLCAQSFGSSVILWTVDTRDWAHTPSEKISEYVISTVKSGDIILMHDYVSGRSPTPAALKVIIPTLIKNGFSFVTISELLESD